MTFYVENEVDEKADFSKVDFSIEELFEKVATAVLDREKCPYEATVNLVITDNEGIHEYNKNFRNIDRETDVLSFPGVDFEAEADFSGVEESSMDYFDPETGELLLGDMIISLEKAKEQAENYGHSLYREIGFLIAHSMLHLCGYDHMTEKEAAVMEAKQEEVLKDLGITRD